MMSAITLAIRQFFNMFTVLFSAGEKTAKAVENLADWAEQASGTYSDIAKMERSVTKFSALAEARIKAKALGMKISEDLDVQDAPVKAIKSVA